MQQAYEISDTICAIATPQGKGAISVIRVSGTQSKHIVNLIFKPTSKDSEWFNKANSVHYGIIYNASKIVDDVLVTVFTNPRSYTGEDSIEINCHASVYVQNEILKLLLQHGARLANPGEFTMRAYLNGKMDLSQAEAVADLLASGSAATHKLAISQMKGGYSKELKDVRKNLLHFLAMLELELDFSEEEVEFANRNELQSLAESLHTRISSLIQSFELGNAIKNGIPVCIVGEPNVGKSTLLNAILNEEKAIVSDVPGTTRDVIEDSIIISGVTFRFMDTAGIRKTSNIVEQMGIDRTFKKIEDSAFVLLLIDVTSPLHVIKKNIIAIKDKIQDSKKLLLIVNKIDLLTQEQLEERFNKSNFPEMTTQDYILFISAKKKLHIQSVIDKLVENINYSEINEHDLILTNARHFEALNKANSALERVLEGLQNGLTQDLLSLELRQVLYYVGEITGTISNDEMLGHIFKNFCIGK